MDDRCVPERRPSSLGEVELGGVLDVEDGSDEQGRSKHVLIERRAQKDSATDGEGPMKERRKRRRRTDLSVEVVRRRVVGKLEHHRSLDGDASLVSLDGLTAGETQRFSALGEGGGWKRGQGLTVW